MNTQTIITIVTIVFSIGVFYGALTIRLKNISNEIELSEANIKLYIQNEIKKEVDKVNKRINKIENEMVELKLDTAS